MPSLTPLTSPTDWLWSSSMWSDLFSLDAVPLTEKVVRTVLVYLVIAVIIRLTGKRTLAQWNSFDLVVVLLLSNVVQNAIIGPDNSLLGGAVGAVVLVGFNAVVDRISFLGKDTEMLLEGRPTILITDGVVDEEAMRRMGLRQHELLTALHQQGADSPGEVRLAALQPGGTFNVSLMRQHQTASRGELEEAVARLQQHLDDRLDALEARLLAEPGRRGE